MSDEVKNMLGGLLALTIGEKLVNFLDKITVRSEKFPTTEVCDKETYIADESRPLNARWWKLRTEVSVPQITVYETGDIEAADDIEIRTFLQSPRHTTTLFANCLNCTHLDGESQ